MHNYYRQTKCEKQGKGIGLVCKQIYESACMALWQVRASVTKTVDDHIRTLLPSSGELHL